VKDSTWMTIYIYIHVHIYIYIYCRECDVAMCAHRMYGVEDDLGRVCCYYGFSVSRWRHGAETLGVRFYSFVSSTCHLMYPITRGGHFRGP